MYAGPCEGRRLAVDSSKEETYCWGQKSCNEVYSSKSTLPHPCVWDVATSTCLRNDDATCLACPKCGTLARSTNEDSTDVTGERSCCAPGGAWYGRCGDGDGMEFTWTHGIKACERTTTIYSCLSFLIGIVPLSRLYFVNTT